MKKKGRGMATIMFGFGYGEGFPDHSIAEVEITPDNIIKLRTAGADVGQGFLTTMTQIAAEVLKIDPSYIEIVGQDTHQSKNSGSTSATRQTFFSGNAVREASEELMGKLYHYGSLHFNSNHPELTVNNGEIYHCENKEDKITYFELADNIKKRGESLSAEASFFPKTYAPDKKTGQTEKNYVAYTFMTQVIDLKIDTDTGLIEVLNVYTALDVGKAINPINVEGQIEGGTVQGLGMALTEDQVIKDGITLNPDMTNYLVPSIKDIPNFESILIENEDSDGPFGAKGVGEPTLIAASPAVANAVYDAIGVRIKQLPITPEKILKALEESHK
ncbi:MAG: molybdopterin-dependent oxidoreductase [Halanaerobiales bacterium]|nr:molybdopterin-dependent oxidoreductase [Halanaerobiales bacterium]